MDDKGEKEVAASALDNDMLLPPWLQGEAWQW
jgi:hypothetical protein